MSVRRGVCGFNLKDIKKNTELRESLGLKPVSLVIRSDGLQWFGHTEHHTEHKDDADRVT